MAINSSVRNILSFEKLFSVVHTIYVRRGRECAIITFFCSVIIMLWLLTNRNQHFFSKWIRRKTMFFFFYFYFFCMMFLFFWCLRRLFFFCPLLNFTWWPECTATRYHIYPSNHALTTILIQVLPGTVHRTYFQDHVVCEQNPLPVSKASRTILYVWYVPGMISVLRTSTRFFSCTDNHAATVLLL